MFTLMRHPKKLILISLTALGVCLSSSAAIVCPKSITCSGTELSTCKLSGDGQGVEGWKMKYLRQPSPGTDRVYNFLFLNASFPYNSQETGGGAKCLYVNSELLILQPIILFDDSKNSYINDPSSGARWEPLAGGLFFCESPFNKDPKDCPMLQQSSKK